MVKAHRPESADDRRFRTMLVGSRGTGMGAASGRLVISFDFELFWGVRDSTTLAKYGPNILGVREAVPRLLEVFEKYGIRATWSTVGFLFFEDKDELLAHLPDVRPQYADQLLSPYHAIDRIGRNEKSDPYHFGLSLIRRIQECPGQEIGTHTFSHFYCLAAGQDEAAFRADLEAARRAGARIGVQFKSITFPRHQINDAYLRTCRDHGLIAFRGHPRSWMHDPDRRKTPLRRALRFADSYVAISGPDAVFPGHHTSGLIDVPASRFLRPFSPRARSLEGMRFRRIADAMKRAARKRAIYHLWWHPHNFGANMDQNFAMLQGLAETFRELALEYGMQGSTIGEIAELTAAETTEATAVDGLPETRETGSPRVAGADFDRAGA